MVDDMKISPEASPEPSKKKKASVMGLAAATAALGATLAADPTARDAAASAIRGTADAIHALADPSKTEQRIRAGLEEAFGTTMLVRCAEVPEVYKDSGTATNGATYKLFGTETYTHVIRLEPWVCETAAQFVIDRSTLYDSDDLQIAANALEVITHEAAHIEASDSHESNTNCRTLQRSRQVATALGAADGPAEQLRAELQRRARYNESQWRLPEYQITSSCHDGGPLDMDPNEHSTSGFPYLPPIAS